MTIYYKTMASMLLFAAGACTARTDPEMHPLPRVLEVKDAVGLRCGLASVYYHFDLGAHNERLYSSLLASPNGLSYASMDPLGVRVFDLLSGRERIIEGTRPVMWSRDSKRLYVVDNHLRFRSFVNGKVADEPWLNELFGDALKQGTHIGRPDLFFAGNGLIAVPRAAARILVANLETRTSFSVVVGLRKLSPRPFSEMKIGWDTKRNEPALFVAHQSYSGELSKDLNPHAIKIVNRVDVYGPQGQHNFSGAIEGSEVAFLPLLLDGRSLVLSRLGENRCINALTADGKVEPHLTCDTDLDTAYVDRRGRLLAASTFLEFEPHNELRFSAAGNEVAHARLLAAFDDGRAMYIVRNAGRGKDEIVVVADGNVRQTYPVPPHQCQDRHDFPKGVALESRATDGFPTHGFLFSPPNSKPVRALVVHLHGGPRPPNKDRLTNPFARALLDRGFAFAAVNYRGSTGYGRAVLEKPYGGGFVGMLEDAEAIRREALRELKLPAATPVVLHGASYGGFLAVKAAIERAKDYRAFIVNSGVCRVASSVGDVSVMDTNPLPLNRTSDPDVGVHTLRLATDINGKALNVDLCGKRADAGARMVIIHARGDPNAPFTPIQSFANLQTRDQLLTIFFDGVSHDPMKDLAGDQNAFRVAVDTIVQFVEGSTAKN